jgi:hypothetical protein
MKLKTKRPRKKIKNQKNKDQNKKKTYENCNLRNIFLK